MRFLTKYIYYIILKVVKCWHKEVDDFGDIASDYCASSAAFDALQLCIGIQTA